MSEPHQSNEGSSSVKPRGREVKGSPVADAAARGDVRQLELLLSAGADVGAVGTDGWTPLFYAALGGCAETLEILLAAGADVNARASDGSTVLLKATLWGRAPMVQILLRHGADATLADHDGWTPMKVAEKRGFGEILASLSG